MGKKIVENNYKNRAGERKQFPMGKVKQKPNAFAFTANKYQFPMGKVKTSERITKIQKRDIKYQFPMGKVEELSKSLIWLTTPMQQRSKSGFIRDWLSATAKGDRYQCTFRYRTSIPYGKGKAKKEI